MNTPDDSRFTSDTLEQSTMDDELCLFVHSLLLDGRAVRPDTVERARQWASEHPAVAAAIGDFSAMSAALTPLEGLAPSADFTDRVLAARHPPRINEVAAAARPAARLQDGLAAVRRLSVAAALAIVTTLGYGVMRPAALFADDDPASLQVQQVHEADSFHDSEGRATPEAFEAGLDGLIEGDARLAPDELDALESQR